MSANDGVYVLYTDSDKGPEYRVKHAFAIDNIYGPWNPETNRFDGNIEQIKSTFVESPVFYSLNEALDYAEQEEDDVGPTEDGVSLINIFKDYGYIFA